MRRRLAKTLFRVAGYLSKIQTPRKTYRLVSMHPFVTESAGRRWLPCKTSVKILKWSTRLDWDHWDHWALDHGERCGQMICPVCGSCLCVDIGVMETEFHE